MRNAILLAWERGDINLLNDYFGYTIRADRGRPTNKEFIATVADNLRMEERALPAEGWGSAPNPAQGTS